MLEHLSIIACLVASFDIFYRLSERTVQCWRAAVQTTQDCFTPVGLGEEGGEIGLADEVFISHLADSGDLFLPAGQSLQIKGGLDFGPHHAQVRGQQVDEDLRGESKQLT